MQKVLVGIDPGHGGRDPGAVGLGGTKEKDVTLAISLKVAQILRAAGVDVLLTRNTDTHLGADQRQDLFARSHKFNTANCDIAVSIHCNSSANRAANYFSVYVIGLGGSAEKLAKLVVGEIKAATNWHWGSDDDGVREKNLHMLRETKMPAILIECNFISNAAVELQLKNPAFQQVLAEAIAKGILKYFKMEVNGMPEQWKLDIIEKAKQLGLITQDHNPDEPASKWFVLQVSMNALNIVESKKKQ